MERPDWSQNRARAELLPGTAAEGRKGQREQDKGRKCEKEYKNRVKQTEETERRAYERDKNHAGQRSHCQRCL